MNWAAIIWLALMVVFFIVEASTVTLVSLWFAAGALGAVVMALLGGYVGAELDLAVVIQPVTILVGVIYILARSAGKYFGSYASCKANHCAKPITDNLGITLLPQAGVALGMALTATALRDGALVRNVILFSVLIYELVGPALTKRSLLAVGEIQPEGRTSARRHNAPIQNVPKTTQKRFLAHKRHSVPQTAKK